MSETVKSRVLQRMDELGIQPKRSLGQNFLVSDNVVDKIIQAADPAEYQKVFEIGPGLGALTDHLIEKSKNLKLIELDRVFADYWRKQNQDVVEKDALHLAWSEELAGSENYLLVSNLPYQISARLVVDLSLEPVSFSRMVLMFQKEVAGRIMATPGSKDYGLLSVVAQSFWKLQLVLEAGSVDFMPKPRVASRVVRFDYSPLTGDILNHRNYMAFLKICFANRRKKLLPKLTQFQDKLELEQIFEKLSLSIDVRAEKLSVPQFIDLYLELKSE